MPDSDTDRRFQVAVPVADIRGAAGGARLRQLLYGETVVAEGERDGWIAVRADRDGYRGVMDPEDLCEPTGAASHKVTALATHLYTEPDIKSADIASLSFGARLTLTGTEGAFGQTDEGLFVPMVHVAQARRRFADPAAVAELFLGTPYLWGGNSRLGIDCSGLVQTACLACGLACPGDSGEQELAAGAPVDDAAPLARGDLLFWLGHVAMAVGNDMLIHANAHHMAVVFEPAEDAVRRISAAGGGGVTARRRLAMT